MEPKNKEQMTESEIIEELRELGEDEFVDQLEDYGEGWNMDEYLAE